MNGEAHRIGWGPTMVVCYCDDGQHDPDECVYIAIVSRDDRAPEVTERHVAEARFLRSGWTQLPLDKHYLHHTVAAAFTVDD